MRAGVATVEVEGERLVLFPERLAWWERRATLLVADAHWGKGAAFRAAGIPVPQGTTLGGLARLDSVLERTGATRVVFLGDYLHAKEGRAPGTLRALAHWRDRRPSLELTLVRGNHDRHAGDPARALGFDVVEAPARLGPFTLLHHPRSSAGAFTLAGHLHPAVRLRGPGRSRERLPCFVVTDDLAILPAFGAFTGNATIEPSPDIDIYAIAGDEVIRIKR